MTDFLLDVIDIENLKLALFLVLIGSVIGLSHLNDESLDKMKRAFRERRWRAILPSRRLSGASAIHARSAPRDDARRKLRSVLPIGR